MLAEHEPDEEPEADQAWATARFSLLSRSLGSRVPKVTPQSGINLRENSTIAFNAPGAGFGPSGYPQSTQITLRNSVLANNGNQQNCSSFYGFICQGKSISSDWSCGEVGITVADPQLLPLANDGGPNMGDQGVRALETMVSRALTP